MTAVAQTDTTTTTVRGRTVGGVPGLYVEDAYGCSWEYPDDVNEQGWRDVTYSAQAIDNPDDPGDLPLVEVSGYAPRSTVVGLAREVADLRETVQQLGRELRTIRMALSLATLPPYEADDES